jgi:hypothetical protein
MPFRCPLLSTFLFCCFMPLSGQTILTAVAPNEGTPNQSLLTGPYQLTPVLAPTSCADVAGVSKLNGAAVQLWNCGGTLATNQYWSLVPATGIYGTGYMVVSLNSGSCLDIIGSSLANGTHLQQWQCLGATHPNQLWQFVPFNGAYELVSLSSGLCLDLPGGNTANGNFLQQWSCGHGQNPNQLWNITPVYGTPPSIPSNPSTSAVPANFFGLSTLNFQSVQPSIPYGTARSWDEYPTLDWADANPVSGVYNFSFIDAFISLNQSRGADMIYTFGRTPQWASSAPTAYTPYGPGQCAPPTNLSDWDKYVTALATHVAGRIHYWEIWNEPQDPHYYCGDIPTLINMAGDAYHIIKSIDPTTQIITPSVTASGGPAWLNQYLQAGGGQFADIMSFHGYWGPVAESIQTVVQSYRSVLAANGQSTKPLWDTEASWAGDPSNVLQGYPQRAAFLTKYYLLQWSDGVSRFVWYAYDGGTWGGLWDPINGLHADGVAYRIVQQWMLGSQMASPCTVDDAQTWTCNLLRNGDHAEVIWNSTTSISLQVSGDYTKQSDLMGNTTSIAGSKIQVGNSPVLLRTDGPF